MASPLKEVRLKYEPRDAFKAFHKRKQRRAVVKAHRRSGKTVMAINELISQALYCTLPRPQYLYVAPLRTQAKKIAWDYLKDYAGPVLKKSNESELYVELVNGAKIFVGGADNPDSLRGTYYDGIILDEYAQMKREVWSQALSPTLIDRLGWAVFLGTPKGKSNDFYKKWLTAEENTERWFHMELKASESGLLTADELAQEKADADPEEYEQEFECSFEAAFKGTYYGTHMQFVQKNGQIVNELEYDPAYPVSLAMDIGRNDALAIWFWQVIAGKVNFIDYFEATGWTAEELIDKLDLMYGGNYGTWWVPHDALHDTFASKKSVIDQFIEYGAPARKVPAPDKGNRKFHGINAVRTCLRTYPFVFNAVTTRRGLEGLRNYSRKWNKDTESFADEPKHDQWSHGADAFRYACLSITTEEIQNSAIEARHRAVAAASGRTVNTDSETWTFDDAIRARTERLAQQRSSGYQRV